MQRIAVNGDRAAFRALFEHFAPRLKGYLIRLGLESGRAEELAQEVMVTVWRKAATFDRAQGSVATWVFRIARNRRIDLFRRDRTAQLDEHDPALAPVAEAPPDAALDADQRQIRVAQALAELPPEQRELVRAHFYEDLTHSEIAERTGLALGTVKSRLRLAFGKLRGPLQGYLESDL
ncbi:RNA polymerase sigma-70 factor (ECF subfamily) [Caulobacter ginsengisoli]|uniref:RNA polymerase sigma-70 factor (ECF subfamily) n=1 Tax=Caulobacter ginsengisoli TaxID=400775 RepID=A0ABU0J0N8_9CAUL|nr:sigma-70 family RNA polymerase sigma factor [Caulobacter ginsengisoli]MDQ0466993.1 RNA polymerase sigma-70 factor (ECF subfamily) [Caulobacter ginsengisoli]